MNDPVSSSDPSLSDITAQESWQVASGTLRGKPFILRVNVGADRFAGHPALPHHIGMAVPFQAPQENGLPTPAESEHLNEIEDQLADLCAKSGQIVMVAVITAQGRRELLMYATDSEVARAIREQLQARSPSHSILLNIKSDPAWKTFAQFRRLMGGR